MRAGAGRRGGRVASLGRVLPSGQPVPHAAAEPARRWSADGGVKKAALAAAALHHALAGDRQPAAGRTPNGRSPTKCGTPWGAVPRADRLAAGPTPPERALAASAVAIPSMRRERLAGTARPVERAGSSDMLPELNYLEISRGFEFSVTCIRHCRPCRAAVEAGAIGRSRGRSRRLEQRRVRALDPVRKRSSSSSRRTLRVTQGSGGRGGVPPSFGTRGRADRHATPRRPLEFRSGALHGPAARALHRSRGGRPIGRFRRWSLDHEWSL